MPTGQFGGLRGVDAVIDSSVTSTPDGRYAKNDNQRRQKVNFERLAQNTPAHGPKGARAREVIAEIDQEHNETGIKDHGAEDEFDRDGEYNGEEYNDKDK